MVRGPNPRPSSPVEIGVADARDIRGFALSHTNERHYHLRCPACGSQFEDDGFLLACPLPHGPSLLATSYSSRTLESDSTSHGVGRYRCWLPGTNRLIHVGQPATFQSESLSAALRLPNLWITFSGYWPERGATLETATFKELEVAGVLSRMPANGFRALVVASAGNTAAAFARSCSENDVPCLIVVPVSGMKKMRFVERLKPSVKIVCLSGRATYSDAIAFAEKVSSQSGFVSEGGVRNVGRRDGMATAMFNAVESIGRLPDYYFQAIGSGAGAIAAHEAAKRLVCDSRFGRALPCLMLSQNLPFTPIHDSWKRGRRELVEIHPLIARSLTEKISATVLSNQRPPYSTIGGVYDILSESRGDMFAVENDDVLRAMRLFERCEGIDIDPAAGVALASLTQAANSGLVKGDAIILLHVTGGGAGKRAAEQTLIPAVPDLDLPLDDLQTSSASESARALFADRKAGRKSKAASA